MLKFEEILNNSSLNNAMYLSTHNDKEISLHAFTTVLQKIEKTYGNGPIKISCEKDPFHMDEDPILIVTVATSDNKIHSFHIHP